MALLRRSTTLR